MLIQVSLRYQRALNARNSKKPRSLTCRFPGLRLCPRGDTLHTHTAMALINVVPEKVDAWLQCQGAGEEVCLPPLQRQDLGPPESEGTTGSTR
jgi:hypothetical protein